MKKIMALLLVLSVVFMTACSSSTTESEVGAEVSGNASYPMTVVDQAGREVTIESEPQRLVSSYYITSSLFIALGIDDRIVGIESEPYKRNIYELSAPELLDLPWVGSPKDFDFEACVALEPDLVVLPLRLSDVADKLEKLDIDVLLVNPENEAGLIAMTELVATATNTSERGQELIAFIERVKTVLNDSLGDAQPVSVYLTGNSDFLSTSPKGMYQSDMIALAGGKNVAAEIDDTYWVEVSYEQVLVWNPQYIILAANAEYDVDSVMNDESLSICDAVINGNVYKLPAEAEAWDSPVPGTILGSLWLANVLYPDKITDEQCYDLIEEFYETFYGFSYSSITTAEAA
ncbi:MAG: ABC transporter substrate-binding protein [Saccharofermentans sp.]|nr:ABC transporter substrate-binding protein [Saccharofermentans sp.]